MTPKNSKPKPSPEVDFTRETWEAGALDREIDMYFDWDFYCRSEERSLDRMHEMHLREEATTRTVMKIKDKIRAAGIWVPPSSREHFLAAADFRGWAKTETDPKKKAELISLGNLAEGNGRAAFKKEVAEDEARKARNAKRAARRKARKAAAKSPQKPRRRKS